MSIVKHIALNLSKLEVTSPPNSSMKSSWLGNKFTTCATKLILPSGAGDKPNSTALEESGLPIGIKSAIGKLDFWQELARKIKKKNR